MFDVVESFQGWTSSFFSLDAEKVFDRVEWGFIHSALSRSAFGNLMNEVISSFFNVSRGTRQPCPPPLLFTVDLEALAVVIRTNPSIKAVVVKSIS